MSVFKCKMCGGTIDFEAGATVGVCDSCGTKQTLPRLGDDKIVNLYDRANHFRRNNDYDKAMSIYEQILNENNTDAEAYWSLVLCRYGIEYVEDPKSHKRIPTVNRVQFTSIYMDEDYKTAIQYADISQKAIYEEEAKQIDSIQKGILEISSKETHFDVFICYKETDANGRRTQDSVLATELYHELTNEGFKVFFSRITLEDKLGIAYEPYIFAALNSSKVMVVLGTKPEYFNAVWVKNEWSRYLALIKKGAKKMLIPAYRDMDPYDLPEEFSHLQAQDMAKLGFMQDLIRGITKILNVESPKETAREKVKETMVVNQISSANTAPLLERAFLFLEDGKWNDADKYCEKVLDINPKNAEAYLGKLMVELQVKIRKQLAECAEPFDDNDNYNKVMRFGNTEIKAELRGYITQIKVRNENTRLEDIYNKAKCLLENAQSENQCQESAEAFKSINGFKDAELLIPKCFEKIEILRKDEIYNKAQTLSNSKNGLYILESAMNLFQSIQDWRDSEEQIKALQKKIEDIEAQEEVERLENERKANEDRIADETNEKKRKVFIAIIASIVCICILLSFVIKTPRIIADNAETSNVNETVCYKESVDIVTDSVTKKVIIDPNAKDYGVLTYAEFLATEEGKEVVIEAFLQAKYDYHPAYSNTSLYLADGDGAYYVYRFSCTQEVYDTLTVGAKYKITGTKATYAGEIEVSNVTALEAVGTDTYVAEVTDVTAKFEDAKLSDDMNKYVAIKGAEVAASQLDDKDVAFLYKYNGSGAQGDDLYFNVKVGDKTYTYCVESDFCNKDTEVYKAVEALKVGDKINLEGYLYWYNAARLQVTSVDAAK